MTSLCASEIEPRQAKKYSLCATLTVTLCRVPVLVNQSICFAPILAGPLSILFNSFIASYFPPHWKKGNLTTFYKKNEKFSPTNYKPISLLSQLGKCMERCIHKNVYNYIRQHNRLNSCQSGFIPGDYMTLHLLHTYHTFCEAVDNGKEVHVNFCDISMAFDIVWHTFGMLWNIRKFTRLV